MLPDGIELRPMKGRDLDAVLGIIRAHDEDDFEEAEESYEESGVEGQYVLTEHGKVVGVTGCRPIEVSDNSYWLSWTYLAQEARGRGLGRAMLDQLMADLTEQGARKLFVNTSDYAEPDEDPLYEDAHKLYEALGFRLELSYKDYYAPGESRLTYARRLGALYGLRPKIEPDDGGVELVEVFEIDETEGAFAIDWDYAEDESMFSAEDLERMTREARDADARCIFIGFPSSLVRVAEAMKQSRFVECGRLVDFFEDGLDEVHYRLDL
ncbi:MAG: GNAT family N-acetyltransferase [Thermodesulfobacteriota bacterium]